MSTQPNSTYEYQVGGALLVDAPSYVVREADEDLYNALKAGKFCYVLNSRQMGKSSLRVRTKHQLENEKIACASIDLTGIGSEDVTSDKWYTAIIYELKSNFSLEIDLKNWLREHNDISPVYKLRKFIEQVLLDSVHQNIVIFVDEIDSVLGLNFRSDDFFAFIRFCYNQRAEQPEYRRLTFALLGVATPSDLIQDKNRSPFNIGHAIDLTGFQFQEAQFLAQGLVPKTSNSQAVLQEILIWTGGQPFLTQKLCQIVQTAEPLIPESEERLRIENIVRSSIVESWESHDEQEHLKTIRKRLLKNEQRAGYLLGLYQKILQQEGISADDSEEQMELRLTGLVVKQQGKLQVYNCIYKEVFGQQWIKKELADLRPPFYREAITAWLASNREDESCLLRADELKNAKKWSSGRNLSSEDNEFLNASRELHSRELEKVVGPTNLKFNHEEASSIFDLIDLLPKYQKLAEDYLFDSDYLEDWLFNRSETNLANLSRRINDSYQDEKPRGLEIFLRGLCKQLGRDAHPKIFFEPPGIELAEIPVGYRRSFSLKVGNNGRGFAWGDVTLEGNDFGVNVPDKFDSSRNETFDIELDTLELEPGDYQTCIAINLEGIEYPCRIPIHYKIREIQLYLDIELRELDLGVVPHDIITNSLKITCKFPDVRLKGTASTDMAYLQVTPDSFEDSSLDFSLALDTTPLEAGQYNTAISLNINGREFQVPVSFRKPLRWDVITRYTTGLGIPVGLSMYCIRLILGHYLSVCLDDNSWILSAPLKETETPLWQLISPFDIFTIPETKLKLSIFGCILICGISVILYFVFHNYFNQLLENFRLKIEVFSNFVSELKHEFVENNWSRPRYNYYPHSSATRNIKITLLLLLIIIIAWLTIELIFSCLLTFFTWIGLVFVVFTDLTAYSTIWVGIEQPAVGWLILGCLIGGTLGITLAPKLTRLDSWLFKFYVILITSILVFTLLVIGQLTSSYIKPEYYPFRKIVITENFTKPLKTKIFSSNNVVNLKNGGLLHKKPEIDVIQPFSWNNKNHVFKDFEFSVDTLKTNNNDDIEYGVIARYAENSKSFDGKGFYYLLIKGNDRFSIGKYSEIKKWENKVGWQKSTALKQGKIPNRLRIVCNKNRVIGWINNQRIGMFIDDSYIFGQIGLISKQDSDKRSSSEKYSVFFDNVRVKEKYKEMTDR